MKKPEEIKKGLEVCSNDTMLCYEKCPYFSSISNGVDCAVEMKADALAYIQQLEADKVSLLESSHEMRKEMISKIKQLEAKVPRWISVEERLPESCGVYIAHIVHRYCKVDSYSRVCIEYFDTDNTWASLHDVYEVTHWMPIPEPPTEV